MEGKYLNNHYPRITLNHILFLSISTKIFSCTMNAKWDDLKVCDHLSFCIQSGREKCIISIK